MDERDILGRVHELVDEEHTLREQLAAGDIDGAAERERLQLLENELDQCWDLLRRRRAAKEAGLDSLETGVRTVREVRRYLQ
ncbi:MAG: DUF2630 family protein [Streptosporangiales bacterium]|nr:DUF2630 family protein [Streptosporangiales bacterium]